MILPNNLSPSLFWDVDVTKLDWETHKQLIAERVIQRGNLKEIQEVINHYGMQETRNIIKRIPALGEKDLAFVHIYFNIPLDQLKCYTNKRSAPDFLH